MNQLTTTAKHPEFNAQINALSFDVKEYALACSSGKILKHYSYIERIDRMSTLIIRTHANCGITYNKEITLATIEELVDDLHMEFGSFTFEEIELAFKKGWKKHFGEFYGLNNATYYNWVLCYSREEARLRAKKEIARIQANLKNAPKVLTPEESDKIVYDGLLLSYESFQHNKNILIPTFYYDFLRRKELISFNETIKNELMTKAKAELIAEERLKKFEAPILRHKIDKTINEIQSNDKYQSTINRAKQLAVKLYFETQKELVIKAISALKSK